MKHLLTDINFNTQFPNICEELLLNNKIDEFIKLSVSIGDKTLSIMNVKWSCLDIENSIFTTNLYDSLNEIDPEQTQAIFLKALSYELLSSKSSLKLFNSLKDKQIFYKNIRSFKTLFEVEKAEIPIWIPLIVNKTTNKENLLPVTVWEYEVNRKDLLNTNKILRINKKLDFFLSNKNKWIDIKTDYTSNQQFHSQLAYRMTRIQKHKNFIKTLGIKLNIEDNYNQINGVSFNIKELLLIQGLIKNVTPNNKFNDLDIIKLITGKIIKPNQISVKKNFLKLWNNYLPQINFSFQDEYGNLANHTFRKTNKSFYLPMRGDLTSISKNAHFEDFYSESNSDSYSPSSFNKWLNFLSLKKINFLQKNSDGISAYTQSLNYISRQEEYNYSDSIINDGILLKQWNNFTFNERKQIFNEYMDGWDSQIADGNIAKDFLDKANSWQTRSCVADILQLFLNENFFTNSEINHKIISFLNPFTKNDHNMELITAISFQYFQYFNNILVKEEKAIKAIKL